MPLVDSNQAALWDGGASSLYRSYRAGGETPLGYVRAVKDDYMGVNNWMAEQLRQQMVTLGLQIGQRIAFIGAGFGWVSEHFLAMGYGPMADGTAAGRLCNVDTSTWIQSNTAGNAQSSILNADVNGATGRRTIRQQFGSNSAEVHWCVTEDVLPLLIGAGPTPAGNNEIVPFCDSCRNLMSVGVVHWLTTRIGDGSAQDSRLNWKSLEEWKAWTTPDRVVAKNENGRML